MMRALAGLFALLLLAFALVQLNDPDPIGWTAIYGASAAVSLAFARRRPVGRWAATLAAIAAVWALMLAPEALRVQRAELGQHMDVMRPEIEVARELGGLSIVLVWMLVLSWSAGRRAAPRPPPARPPRDPTPARS